MAMSTTEIVHDGTIPDLTKCAAPLSPLARRELRLAAVLANTHVQTAEEAAPILGVSITTARTYLKLLAPKLPGDIPSDLSKVRVWARGASPHILGVRP